MRIPRFLRRLIRKLFFTRLECEINYEWVKHQRGLTGQPRDSGPIILNHLIKHGFGNFPTTKYNKNYNLSVVYVQYKPKFKWMYKYLGEFEKYKLLPRV